ncbi:PBECR2 nuclease fold domain-containing protein, partial [Campylobacter felis]|uniref:ADP-ribosyltransferase-containing protein n=1 Tax=Campylobacter felis TaxID=2974565 RepID=UPI0025604C43
DDYFEKMQELKDIENKFYKYITGLEKTKNQIENIQFQIQKANKQAQRFFNTNEPQSSKPKESAGVENESEKLKSDLLDKTKPLRKAEKEELTNELLEQAKEQNAKIWVGNLESENLADELGLNFQKGVKITMNGNALKHIEKRHGVNSALAKNGQLIVENEDYANHAKIVNEADKRKIILSEDNQKILVSGKQINGYHIIIESISTKDNELKLKTMYKENGSLENSNIFKEPVRDRISGGESLRVNPSNSLDPNGSKEIIAQKADQEQWLETFGLKSMEEAYTPKFSKEVKEALEPVLKGDEIKLTKGSFDKLLKRNREEFLPFIKETLENADAVVKQADGALIFAKDYRDERLGKFFASVSRNDEGEWVITSNAPKTLNNLKNKIEEGGELLYSDLPELPIIAKPELSAEALNGEANLNESIPQNSKIINPQTQDLRKRLKEQINQQVEIYRTLRDEAEKKIRERIGEILENNPKYASHLTRYNIKNLHKKITEQKRQKINLEEVRKVQGLIREMKALWKEADNLENFKKQDGEKKNPSPLEKEYYKLESLRSEYGRELEKEVERLEGLEIKHPQEYNYLLALEDEMISPYSEFSWENTRNSRENIRNKMQEYIYKETAKALNLKYFKTKESLLRPLNLYWDQLDGVFELIGERLGVKSESVKIFRPIYPKIRKAIEKHLNLKPLEEFGTNYAEFYRDGKGAIKKLIREAGAFKESGEKGEFKAQVSGAFYREELGDIDLVWGEITDLEKHKGYGLAHILDKHPEFDVFKIPQIIEQGEIQKTYNGYNVVTNDYIVGLNKGFKDKEGKVINDSNVWVVTSFEPQIKGKKEASSIASVTSNYNEPMPHKPLEDIIPQKNINLAMEKFHYDEKKAKDLLEWHKNSHPLTKDENGLPNVFYHGSGARFQVFKKEFDKGKTGFWFTDGKIIAEDFAKDKGGKAIYPVFLKMKNPIWLTYQKEGDKWVFDWLDDEGKALLKEAKNQGLSIDYFQKDFKFKEFLESKGYDGIVLKTKLNGNLRHSVFNPNQIKHIDNKGSFTDKKSNITKNKPKNSEAEHKYFNENSENMYYSNPHIGAGLVGGVLNGVEQDEEGNLSFDPAKFAAGFLGASLG